MKKILKRKLMNDESACISSDPQGKYHTKPLKQVKLSHFGPGVGGFVFLDLPSGVFSTASPDAYTPRTANLFLFHLEQLSSKLLAILIAIESK